MAFQYRLFTLEYNHQFNQLSKNIPYVPLRRQMRKDPRVQPPLGRKDPSRENLRQNHSAATPRDSPDLLVVLQRLLYQLRDFRYLHPSDLTTPQNLFIKTDCYLQTDQTAFSRKTKNTRLVFLTL